MFPTESSYWASPTWPMTSEVAAGALGRVSVRFVGPAPPTRLASPAAPLTWTTPEWSEMTWTSAHMKSHDAQSTVTPPEVVAVAVAENTCPAELNELPFGFAYCAC